MVSAKTPRLYDEAMISFSKRFPFMHWLMVPPLSVLMAAGRNGLESDAVSCGFCLFNSVAIGALHALQERSAQVGRVAVIDFDVHHGNGTQAILES